MKAKVIQDSENYHIVIYGDRYLYGCAGEGSRIDANTYCEAFNKGLETGKKETHHDTE